MPNYAWLDSDRRHERYCNRCPLDIPAGSLPATASRVSPGAYCPGGAAGKSGSGLRPVSLGARAAGLQRAKDQPRIAQVEQHHFNEDTENLTRGMTTSAVGGDIDFLVALFAQSHRGLAALVRLAIRDKTPQPRGVFISVECYLQRALEFTPADAEVMKIYGAYLSRPGEMTMLARFQQAEKIAPDDPVIAYNMDSC